MHKTHKDYVAKTYIQITKRKQAVEIIEGLGINKHKILMSIGGGTHFKVTNAPRWLKKRWMVENNDCVDCEPTYYGDIAKLATAIFHETVEWNCRHKYIGEEK